MRRKLVLSGLALALLLIAGGATIASAGSKQSARGASTEKLVLIAKKVAQSESDLGDKGFSVGDLESRADDLYRNGKKVGDGAVECVTIRFTPGKTPSIPFEKASFQCKSTERLPEGQITLQGIVDVPIPNDEFTLAITGGTGAYRGARGEVNLKEVGPNADRLEVILVG